MRLFVSLALFLLVPIASARAQDRAPADDAPAPRVRVLASGGLDVGALRQRLEALEARVGRCVPASSTDAWQLRLTVAPDGDVIAVADDGPSTDEDRARRRTARCLGRVFAAATLPRPSDGHARVRLRVTRRRAPAGVLGALRGGRGSALGSLGTAGAGGLGLRGTGRGGGGPAPPDPSRDATPGGARGGRPLVAGALSRQEIQGVIRRHLDAIRFCYEQRLAQDPDLAGRVTVRFEISPDGRVRTARVSASTLNDAAVERCVVRQVRRWRFPPPRGGGLVRVNYPFVFRSGGSDEDASDASGEAADDEASAADE